MKLFLIPKSLMCPTLVTLLAWGLMSCYQLHINLLTSTRVFLFFQNEQNREIAVLLSTKRKVQWFWEACFTKERAWKLIEDLIGDLKEGMSEGLWGQISIYDNTRRIYKLKVRKDQFLWLMCAKQGKQKKKQVQKRLASMIFGDEKSTWFWS